MSNRWEDFEKIGRVRKTTHKFVAHPVYLQFAILIFIGLAGIASKEDAGQPDVGNPYKKELNLKILDQRLLQRNFFQA